MLKKIWFSLLSAALVMSGVAMQSVISASAEETDNYIEENANEEGICIEYIDMSDQLIFKGGFPAIDDNEEAVVYEGEGDWVGAGQVDMTPLYNYLVSQIEARSERIYLTDYKEYYMDTNKDVAMDNIINAVYGVLNEHPEFFYVGNGFSYSPTYSGGYYYVNSVSFAYSDDYDLELLDERIEEALSVVKPGMTDEQKAIALHEYIVNNCAYDYVNYLQGNIGTNHRDAYNMYGVLVDNSAVCQGYAEAYKYLLNRVGITAYIVSSDMVNHAWNLIELDGELYYVDTTWDDPAPNNMGYTIHQNMFCSITNQSFVNGHTINGVRDWVVTADYKMSTSITSTSTKYDDAYWIEIYSSLVFKDGYYYYLGYGYEYVEKDGRMSLCDTIDVNRVSAVFSKYDGYEKVASAIKEEWDVYDNVYDIDGKLYFDTDNAIYSMDYSTGKTEKVFSTTGNIYGSMYQHGKVYYATDEPSDYSPQTVLVADISFGAKEYFVIYDANGGVGSQVIQRCERGSQYSLQPVVYTREGYEFAGWNTAADGSGKAYSSEALIKDLASAGETAYLYAQWKIAGDVVLVKGVSINIDGSVTLDLRFVLPAELLNDKGAYVLYDDGKKAYVSEMVNKTVSGVDYSVLSIGIAVKDITDNFTVKLYFSDGTACRLMNDKGTMYSDDVWNVSPTAYLENIADNKNGLYQQRLSDCAKSLLNYAYCADLYFDGTTSGEVADMSGVTVDKLPSYCHKSESGSVQGLNYLGSSAILESNTKIRHYFMLDDGYDINDYTFSCTFIDKTCVYAPTEVMEGVYYVEVDDFTGGTFMAMKPLDVKGKGGNTYKLTYGVYTYIYEVLSSSTDESLKTLVKAMYLFSYCTNGGKWQ